MKKKEIYRKDIFDFDETKKQDHEEFLRYAAAVIKQDHENAAAERLQEEKRLLSL